MYFGEIPSPERHSLTSLIQCEQQFALLDAIERLAVLGQHFADNVGSADWQRLCGYHEHFRLVEDLFSP